ncbi:MAG TPA: class I SAM-dependent methyltransferase [Thermoanaerobaculia bacterium]
MTFAYQTAENNPLVAVFVPASGRFSRLCFDVHAEDEMFLHYWNLLGGDRDRALAVYFDSGRRIWETMATVLRWRFGELRPDLQLLDFASGYGRVTRFAAVDLPPERIWVADVYEGGVRFQNRAFGVHGLVSHADPDRFKCGETFDTVAVSSLFTHLPEASFRAWIRRLFGLLRPGGVLAFSVHDEVLLPPGRELPPSGILFERVSESGSLPTEQYGTSWVNEAFVRRVLAEAAPGASLHRVPRGLLSFQDLYVAVPEADCDFTGLPLRAAPDGFVEHCSLVAGRLRLAGWVVDRARGAAPRELRISIGGTCAVLHDFEVRDQVGALFPYEKVTGYGWRAEVPLSPEDLEGLLTIEAVDAAGGTSTLYAESIPDALLRSARLDLHATRVQLEQRGAELAAEMARGEDLRRHIAAMEASRFWKLRNLWWEVKRRVGLA